VVGDEGPEHERPPVALGGGDVAGRFDEPTEAVVVDRSRIEGERRNGDGTNRTLPVEGVGVGALIAHEERTGGDDDRHRAVGRRRRRGDVPVHPVGACGRRRTARLAYVLRRFGHGAGA
jgi:hypothetical protein